MKIAAEVVKLARGILDGDDSMDTVAALEASLDAFHPGEESLDDLVEALALYSPSMGSPFTDFQQIREAIRESPILDAKQ